MNINKKLNDFYKIAEHTETPPIPNKLLFEISNICNHKCVFCAYKDMSRPKGVVDPQLFRNIVTQAYSLGVREIGLHSGAEPFVCKELEEHIEYCHKIGFGYIYLSTNGSLATKERIVNVIKAGLHSIKFSLNAGTREIYKTVHGKDHFEKVCELILFTSEYRKKLNRPFYLALSFVEVDENKDSFNDLCKLFEPVVDEILHFKANNQSGQIRKYPPFIHVQNIKCPIPFKQINVSREGYLRVCCNDYDNMLAIEDLNKLSLKTAWNSQRFNSFRKKILSNELNNTLCFNCMMGGGGKVKPLNNELCNFSLI
ncbi:MAG: radical SAM/SPASM domain-containing protein [Candidatus Margulisiibacteriota bacterium]